MISLWDSSLQEKASELHDDTWSIEMDGTIEENRPARDWQQYISGSFAQFKCSICKRTWPSKRVLVVFHFHLNTATKQGTIKVRRYKQECRKCNEPRMEDPNFSEDNINVLTERLVDRIRMRCYGENLALLMKSTETINCSEPTTDGLITALKKNIFSKTEIRPVIDLKTPTNINVTFALYGILDVGAQKTNGLGTIMPRSTETNALQTIWPGTTATIRLTTTGPRSTETIRLRTTRPMCTENSGLGTTRLGIKKTNGLGITGPGNTETKGLETTVPGSTETNGFGTSRLGSTETNRLDINGPGSTETNGLETTGLGRTETNGLETTGLGSTEANGLITTRPGSTENNRLRTTGLGSIKN
ncbi:receptor-transporting 3-like protein [Labeo rohita]|uniref:Receptor-transporting 3-like protein n=1 Tax=Labeo rohita TaxID=84645 RepID=A0A498LYH3_LABRO|nr:receptor-transporting 3-like protein [Labeo rohita]